jgi:hypothetical protein
LATSAARGSVFHPCAIFRFRRPSARCPSRFLGFTRSAGNAIRATDAFGRRPLSGAYRLFVGPTSKGSFGSTPGLPSNGVRVLAPSNSEAIVARGRKVEAQWGRADLPTKALQSSAERFPLFSSACRNSSTCARLKDSNNVGEACGPGSRHWNSEGTYRFPRYLNGPASRGSEGLRMVPTHPNYRRY